MSNMQEDQFLPLDSSIKANSIPQYLTSVGYQTDSLCGQQSQVYVLSSKISQLQKSYIEMQKKYVKKIRQLKQQLIQKHHLQSTLNQQLSNLVKQYEQHKSQIQKISVQIKKSFQQITHHQQKQNKLKSSSPKNHTNNSPKRLIKKSLQIAKKQILPSKKQSIKNISASHQINISSNTERSDKKLTLTTQLTRDQKKQLLIQQTNLKNSQENSLNSSNQTKNGRKIQYSPSNMTNGPSPKKKLLFNSSKQLDLFSKQLPQKKLTILTNGSPSRKINISPTHKKNQNIISQNKKLIQKQILTDLPIIQEKPLKLEIKQNESKKVNNLGTQPLSPANRKKQQSPQNAGFLRKKISNKNLNIKTEFQEQIKEIKSKQEQKDVPMKNRKDIQINKSVKQIKVQQRQNKTDKKIQTQKKLTKSPPQSSKNINISPQSKFSPARKLLRNSPTNKKTQLVLGVRPKLFTNMREKLDQNLFK